MDTFSPSYLTYRQPLLQLTTPSLLKCSAALISLMLDSCSQHTVISGCSHFPLLFLFLNNCQGSQREGLGGTVIVTTIVFCFHLFLVSKHEIRLQMIVKIYLHVPLQGLFIFFLILSYFRISQFN